MSEIGPTIERDHAIEVLKLIWKKEDEEAEEAEQLLEKEKHENY